MRLFFFLNFFVFFNAFGEERKESFIVTIDHGHMKVVSPVEVKKNSAVIIENQTMTTLHAKIRSDEKNLVFFAVSPASSKSIDINFEKNKKIFFVPLSPPSSDIELVAGREVYEIPPKK